MNMNKAPLFAYALRGRIIWISDSIFHIPVIHDLYRVYLLEEANGVTLENCTDYIIAYHHKFIHTAPVLSPLADEELVEFKMAFLKIKTFVRLSRFVNYSYQASLPLVFSAEEDKIHVLADTLIDTTTLNTDELSNHHTFIKTLIYDKKYELKKRYIDLCKQIKETSTLEEIRDVSYKVVYEGINIT